MLTDQYGNLMSVDKNGPEGPFKASTNAAAIEAQEKREPENGHKN